MLLRLLPVHQMCGMLSVHSRNASQPTRPKVGARPEAHSQRNAGAKVRTGYQWSLPASGMALCFSLFIVYCQRWHGSHHRFKTGRPEAPNQPQNTNSEIAQAVSGSGCL